MKDFEKIAKAYALKNAISHGGKAMQGAVVSGLFAEGLKKEDMGKYGKEISKIVEEINKLSLKNQEKEFHKLKGFISEREVREGLQELPNADKGVIMRFRPAPSGPMHIGHIISNMINSLYVKKYGGKFYVVIDDTNPEEIIPEAYENLKKDCDWIFGNVTKYLNASDRINYYYDYAKKLIEKGFGYVCTCSQEKFKNFSELKENCPCRNNDKKENLMRWEKMLDKKGYEVGEAVLRFKTPSEGMKHPNPAMRDFPLARINEHEHPLQKNKYRVWPLMNLSVTADDIELKITHIIRGKDHRDNSERQKLIYAALGKENKFPWTSFMGRMKFTDIILSKRKITAAIKEGKYEGAEDERLPTVSSLRKREYNPETFAKFAEQRGLTEVDKVISQNDLFKIIDDFNKEVEDKKI